MAAEDLQTGDPVWAKMRGYPPWPAKIVDPPSSTKTPKKSKANYVMFFGTGDYAWIMNENIIPHSESMLVEAKNRKKSTTAYQNGIDALVSYAKSYKRPKIVKKVTVENNVAKSKVQVVKVFTSVSKKYDRKVLSKSLLKKAKAHKKKSYLDFNGKSADLKLSEFKELSSGRDMFNYHLYEPYKKSLYLNSKHVKASHKSFGFVGLGMMGKQIVRALLESGHSVSVWNRTASQCDIFVEMGAKKARYPADLVISCDIVFSCVSDVEASKAVLFGENGVLTGFETVAQMKSLQSSGYKGFVEMSNIDPFTSQQHMEAVQLKNAAYLEASLCGSSKEAEERTLVVLAAGDRKLFTDCETCFHAIGKHAYFLSCEVGDATKMNLSISRLFGTLCAGLAEAMVFVERLKLQKSDFLNVLENGPLACQFLIDKAHKMDRLQFQKVTALKHMQKDMSLALLMGHQYLQHLPITSGANEYYKHGKYRNYSNEDMSAVYKVVKY